MTRAKGFAMCFTTAKDFGHQKVFRKSRFRNGIYGNGISVWQQLHVVGPDLSQYGFVARTRKKM